LPEAADDGALAGLNLDDAGQQIRDQQHQRHHKHQDSQDAHGQGPPGRPEPSPEGAFPVVPLGFGGLNSRSNSSPWLDSSSMLLLSPRMRWYSSSFFRKA